MYIMYVIYKAFSNLSSIVKIRNITVKYDLVSLKIAIYFSSTYEHKIF